MLPKAEIHHSDRIYLSPPDLRGNEKSLLIDAFDSNWITTVGAHVDAFEREISEKLGVPNAVALCNGTAAIHLALVCLGVAADDIVFCSDFTFVASANPIRYLGAQPVFIDCSRDSWTMDPLLLEEALHDAKKIGRLPKAVIVVDVYGESADYDRILPICGEYGVPVIEDAAEAVGATYKGLPCGSFGSIGILSFNGNKIITTGSGGVLLSRTKEYVDKALQLAMQARDPLPYYQHSSIGYNYRLSNLLAAVGRGQLCDLDKKVARRRTINEYYRKALAGLPGVSFKPKASYGGSNCWLTCVVFDQNAFRARSEDVRVHLESHNVESRHLWMPMHMQPVYANDRHYGGRVSGDLFNRGLCLPSGSALENADIDRICSLIRSVSRMWT